MNHWEFLIQKEGDQAWLPLSQQVEILAGRYRVVAHTNRSDTAVEVRVSQMVLDEMPPRRRVRKRLGQTDADGLILIIPFMWLQPGRWELSCSNTNVADELLGQGWQHSIQLQVLPLTEASQDWTPASDWSEENAVDETAVLPNPETETEASPEADPDHNGSPAHPEDDLSPGGYPDAEALTEQIVNSLFDSIEPLEADSSPLAQARSQPTAITPNSGYLVSLRQQAYVAQRQKPLMIAGQVYLDTNVQAPALLDGQLWIRLRDPQTGRPILETHRRLQAATLPVDFKVQVQLPEIAETRVILGEVLLRLGAAEPQQPALAAAAFTITVGLDSLLEILANHTELDFDEEVSVFPGTTVPFSQPKPSPATLVSPNLPLSPPPSKSLVPAVGQILPPQLDFPEPDATGDHAPKLPGFTPVTDRRQSAKAPTANSSAASPESRPQPHPEPHPGPDDLTADLWSNSTGEPATETAAKDRRKPAGTPQPSPTPARPEPHLPKFSPAVRQQPAIFDSDSIADSDLDADWVASTLAEIDEPGQRPTQLGLTTGSNPGSNALWTEAEADPEADSKSASATSPNGLSSRFMNRLSDLTYASRQATAELRSLMQAAGVQSPELVDPEPSLPPEPVAALPNEVVIYEEEPPSPVTLPPELSGISPEPSPPADLTVPDAGTAVVEIMSPVIAIPNRELIAGETIALTVRLRPQQWPLYIKLWASDRQTRTLVGEPHLLMDLTPNDLGELEAQMSMLIPPDCLEIQFAAIAIAVETHQESDKAVVNRHIVPPGLPTQTLDDLI
ncbi:hypothetical protein IQ241_12390 [Romeria aff. gracilis LEGE 07310]|uniref:Uncharacterized protein n=1 Tax=Vasconcelosia minhoensis LEGE 07310 TaxID=915328 RepID=A0A8J7DM09_9CYAN|nr:hypothetical protein [Romeria gracilis]MBE9078081.1 hypothetical protein [Romeria aff. gracilis LEGE 07310]